MSATRSLSAAAVTLLGVFSCLVISSTSSSGCSGWRSKKDDGCRPDDWTDVLCNCRGECVNGGCVCHPREDPDEVVDGNYCECDNFTCDRYNGLLCSGEDHGECVCGRCQCRPEWDMPGYTTCECSASTDACITPEGKGAGQVCSGRGECVCGQCNCFETADGQYAGRYCQDCPTCVSRCVELTPCMQCLQYDSGPLAGGSNCQTSCYFDVMAVDNAEDYLTGEDKALCSFIDDDDCRAYFVYAYGRYGLTVWAQQSKECPE